MSWLNRRRRKPASSSDPVGEAVTALSGTTLRARLEDLAPELKELPGFVSVADDTSVRGFNTRIDLDDEIHAYLDPAEEGLVDALAEHPGVQDVFSEDREVLYMSTKLALADVHALVVHAVVDLNHNPRGAPPTQQLDGATLDALADQVATILVPDGFQRLEGRGRNGRYFNRVAGDGFVHVMMLNGAAGRHSDGTVLDGRVWLFTGAVIPDLSPISGGGPRFCFPSDCAVQEQTYPLPVDLPAAVAAALTWLGPYLSRTDAAQWFAREPGRILPPVNRPKFALLFAKWGQPEAAGRVLGYLDRTSKSLAQTPEAVEARRLLGR